MPGKVVVLFVGDIIGRPGRNALKKCLPGLMDRYSPSFIIANGENAAGGAGMTEEVGNDLFLMVDVLTSGNHIWDRKEVLSYLDKEPRLLRPANYPSPNPGKGVFVTADPEGRKFAVLNLQGRVFMEPINCPFRTADAELEKLGGGGAADVIIRPIVIVDFHAEATSEKQALGWYLDGRVSAVFGTHTHVPTADERILPGGTAYISDAGMTGAEDSVIGMKKENVIKKFLLQTPVRFEPSESGPMLNGVVVDISDSTGRASSITRIYERIRLSHEQDV
jgi:metallophosphoesterase (TIGR00282 family)